MHHPTIPTPIRHHSNLITAVDTAMAKTAVKLSNLVNIRAIRAVVVGGVSINSIKDRSNTLNSINNTSTQMHLRVADVAGAEALSITGHPLSRDVSYTTQHHSHRTLLPKASTLMGSLHARFRSSK